MYAVDKYGYIPYEYIDGELKFVPIHHIYKKRKIHHSPYSTEHCYYSNNEIPTCTVSLTVKQFPSLKEDGPTQPHHDMFRAAAVKEFTQYVTKRLTDKSWQRPL